MIDIQVSNTTFSKLNKVRVTMKCENVDMLVNKLCEYYLSDNLSVSERGKNFQKINLADEILQVATQINKLRGIV